jgi:hypothetical protein
MLEHRKKEAFEGAEDAVLKEKFGSVSAHCTATDEKLKYDDICHQSII